MPPQSSNPAKASRPDGTRISLQHLLRGRRPVLRESRETSSTPISPKSPAIEFLQLPSLPSTRFVLPHLGRVHSPSPNDSLPTYTPRSATPPIIPVLADANAVLPRLGRSDLGPSSPRFPRPTTHNYIRSVVVIDPAEQHLVDLVYSGRARRKKVQVKERTCGTRIRNKKTRSKIVSSFISGLFLALALTIYLALALSDRSFPEQGHVLMIMIILVTTVFFCHSLICLCILILHPPPDDAMDQAELAATVGPGGYANPSRPIRVALARDEEAAGIESETTKFPPPAYGLWRESVRVDPNRIYWQRAEIARTKHSQNPSGQQHITPNRPPSYISEEGVDYVVEAIPRSIAPVADLPLPPHPSEI